MSYYQVISALLLFTTASCGWCFKSSCLNAETSPYDNLTVLQCAQDEVTIEWNAETDLQYIAFEYSCIHPTNSALSVRNQSFPFWNDGQTGTATIVPLAGALCLFSACYVDQDNTRHYIAPTSCTATLATEDGQRNNVETTVSNVMLTGSPSVTAIPRTAGFTIPTSMRDGRAVLNELQNDAPTPFVIIAAAVLVISVLIISVSSVILILRAKRLSRRHSFDHSSASSELATVKETSPVESGLLKVTGGCRSADECQPQHAFNNQMMRPNV